MTPPKEEQSLAYWMGEVDTKLNSIAETLRKLPCQAHDRDITEIKTKAGFIGGIAGLVLSGAIWILNHITGK